MSYLTVRADVPSQLTYNSKCVAPTTVHVSQPTGTHSKNIHDLIKFAEELFPSELQLAQTIHKMQCYDDDIDGNYFNHAHIRRAIQCIVEALREIHPNMPLAARQVALAKLLPTIGSTVPSITELPLSHFSDVLKDLQAFNGLAISGIAFPPALKKINGYSLTQLATMFKLNLDDVRPLSTEIYSEAGPIQQPKCRQTKSLQVARVKPMVRSDVPALKQNSHSLFQKTKKAEISLFDRINTQHTQKKTKVSAFLSSKKLQNAFIKESDSEHSFEHSWKVFSHIVTKHCANEPEFNKYIMDSKLILSRINNIGGKPVLVAGITHACFCSCVSYLKQNESKFSASSIKILLLMMSAKLTFVSSAHQITKSLYETLLTLQSNVLFQQEDHLDNQASMEVLAWQLGLTDLINALPQYTEQIQSKDESEPIRNTLEQPASRTSKRSQPTNFKPTSRSENIKFIGEVIELSEFVFTQRIDFEGLFDQFHRNVLMRKPLNQQETKQLNSIHANVSKIAEHLQHNEAGQDIGLSQLIIIGLLPNDFNELDEIITDLGKTINFMQFSQKNAAEKIFQPSTLKQGLSAKQVALKLNKPKLANQLNPKANYCSWVTNCNIL